MVYSLIVIRSWPIKGPHSWSKAEEILNNADAGGGYDTCRRCWSATCDGLFTHSVWRSNIIWFCWALAKIHLHFILHFVRWQLSWTMSLAHFVFHWQVPHSPLRWWSPRLQLYDCWILCRAYTRYDIWGVKV